MSDRVILITGASSDIGVALIRTLLSEAAPPLVLAHSFHGEARILTLQEEFGDRVQAIQADFTDAESVKSMADDIAARYGAPHSVVHLPALRLTLRTLH